MQSEALLWECMITYVQDARAEELRMDYGGTTGYTVVPHTLGRCTRLVRLSLHRNALTQMPAALGELSALELLDLGSNLLTELPAGVRGLRRLATLMVDSNYLTALPPWIGEVQGIQLLVLRDNQLPALPDTLGLLGALTRLEVEHNQLTAVPASVVRLSRLEVFHASHNRLNSAILLATLFTNMSQMTSIDLEGNENGGQLDKITAARVAAGLSLELCALDVTGMRYINFKANALAMVPACIGNQARLAFLDVSYNELTALPVSLNLGAGARSLRVLNAQHNQLTSLPGGLANLTALTQLLLYGNALVATPLCDGMLALRFLALHNNRIRAVGGGQCLRRRARFGPRLGAARSL